MNPEISPFHLLILFKNLTNKNQNWSSQLTENFSRLARLFGSSSVYITKPDGETKLSKLENSATVIPCRVYSMLKFILYRRILAYALPGVYLNQGGDKFSPLAN